MPEVCVVPEANVIHCEIDHFQSEKESHPKLVATRTIEVYFYLDLTFQLFYRISRDWRQYFYKSSITM
ncbi:hypothetical protein J27TS8_12860 [Robertmurraya siralis]|uniref:Uncharacterized protein n=1 Tax=Robertmurraya siralis TaxID=77777 RepID=A0A920BSU3_9BACI|nr:hypothetical protein J27TS8_12860 [Robertmurraya siralis]